MVITCCRPTEKHCTGTEKDTMFVGLEPENQCDSDIIQREQTSSAICSICQPDFEHVVVSPQSSKGAPALRKQELPREC